MIGIDEVGRGCWAGPLLIVAARPKADLPAGLKDSKKLSAKQRDKLYPLIIESCDLGEGWVGPDEIDNIGLAQAMILGVQRALDNIEPSNAEEVIMDGDINYVSKIPAHSSLNSRAVIKADDEYPIVSAASIYAKVKRDDYMSKASLEFPGYGFEKHVGYGTSQHLQAMQALGVVKLHRLSFKPVKQMLINRV